MVNGGGPRGTLSNVYVSGGDVGDLEGYQTVDFPIRSTVLSPGSPTGRVRFQTETRLTSDCKSNSGFIFLQSSF